MVLSDNELRQQLSRSEDSYWEFKAIEFSGNKPTSPRRNDLADEMIAFANANGGHILCGVTDDGHIHDMSLQQVKALCDLIANISSDTISPALYVDVQHRVLDEKNFVLVKVPRGDTVYERDGRACIRVGPNKNRIDGDKKLRLLQNRSQARYRWFDNQIFPETGFETLNERFWESLLSDSGATDPRKGLLNLGLLAEDETGDVRVTVAGILLCTKSPHDWLPQATITATCYRGKDRTSGQLDAREIVGPLPLQIEEAVNFVSRNMRVAARKLPARVDTPEYSLVAVFEAIVNAVAHRDYSIHNRRIRISMFAGRLEIDSPGPLPNGLTLTRMETIQATRNELITSMFRQIPVGDTLGSQKRASLMERRGDGVSIIKSETKELTGIEPSYCADEHSVVLTIPAANLNFHPKAAVVNVYANEHPMSDVEILAIFPNKTFIQAKTNELGRAELELYTNDLPMTVYAAAPGYSGVLQRDWIPLNVDLRIELNPLKLGGSVIFPEAKGYLPGLRGRLNPILDSSNRTYLYASNIAIDEGRQQPVTFRLDKPLKLTDSSGYSLSLTILDIVGRSSLLEYRSLE